MAMLFSLIAIHAAVLVRFGVDVPLGDDWRAYLQGRAGSFDLSYLFAPENGTLYPVGKAIDSLVYVWLGGNSVVYQVMSEVVLLGVLVVMQWQLLRLISPRAVAVGMLLTLPMVSVGRYWGISNLAYQQGLPLAFLLVALWLTLRESPWSRREIGAVGLLGITAGLSYISGAVAAVALGLCFLLASRASVPEHRSRLVSAGLALSVPGLAITLWQLSATSAAGAYVPAWPWSGDFWAYALGQLAGSFSLPNYRNDSGLLLLVFVVTAAVAAMAAALGAWALLAIARRRLDDPARFRLAVVILAILLLVGTYAGLTTIVRAYYSLGPNPSATDLFVNGANGHRTFWATLIWPWLVVAAIAILNGLAIKRASRWAVTLLVSAVAVFALLGSASRGTFDYSRWYALLEHGRANVLSCLQSGLDRGERLVCDRGWDLTDAVFGAMADGATFTKYLRFSHSDTPPPLFSVTTATPGSVIIFSDAADLVSLQEGWAFHSTPASQLSLSLPAEAVATCDVLDISITMRASSRTTLTIQAQGHGSSVTLLSRSLVVEPQGTGFSEAYALIQSAGGFMPVVNVRFGSSDSVVLGDIEGRCRMPSA